ncbi:hypothetical protein AAF712_010955 [Marasmius tenuissimus]|uniref:Fungal lipase-type domain-containing protein n=1 Tax=Marasmius tenuissimus TaxID=585030 RepID=A0ABR2ZLS7_9AGAR|nr:hypothetical protein PM082_021882 [Marasmius tenuissimus]
MLPRSRLIAPLLAFFTVGPRILQVFAAPTPIPAPAPLFGLFEDNDAATTTVSIADLESRFLRSAQFAAVAYCSSGAVTSWQCGPPCQKVGKGVKVILAGGDDGLVPGFFVANDPSDNSIVVAHQGTDPFNFLSVLNDALFLLKDINPNRFTSAKDKGIEVHDGFQKTFERTADVVLEAVKKGLADFKTNKVRVTGHSLGAAIATLDSLMFKQELGDSIDLKTAVFGMPRSGNQEFADFVDTTLKDTFTRISNQNDPVTRVPPRLVGYRHASGEIHIQKTNDDGEATDVVACPGQENENCGTGNTIIDPTGIIDHLGPYFDDISFSDFDCPL